MGQLKRFGDHLTQSATLQSRRLHNLKPLSYSV